MTIKTKVFGEVEIEKDKIIHFPSGIICFPELTDFTLLHDQEKGIGAPLHNKQFDIDERALSLGVALQVMLVIKLLNRR